MNIMPFVPAICTQCGSKIDVDNTKEAALCKYCGEPFTVSKAISFFNNYTNTCNMNNVIPTTVQENLPLNENFFKIEHNVLLKYTGYEEIVTVPDGIVKIGDSAFRYGEGNGSDNPYVKIINLPSSCRAIGNGTFKGCSNLEQINGLDNILEIGSEVFKDCSNLKNLTLPSVVMKEIPSAAFMGCSSLERFDIPSTVASISDRAFEGCSSLETLNIPPSVIKIDDSAFKNCKNMTGTFYLPNLQTIGAYVFAGTGYTSLNLSHVRGVAHAKIQFGCIPNLKTLKISTEIWESCRVESTYGGDFIGYAYCSLLEGPWSVLEEIYIGTIRHDYKSSVASDHRLGATHIRKKAEEENKRVIEEKRKMEEQKELWKKQGRCTYCGGSFKGFITVRCTQCGLEKNY